MVADDGKRGQSISRARRPCASGRTAAMSLSKGTQAVLSMAINSAYSPIQKLELRKSNTLNDPKFLCFLVKVDKC